MLRGELDTRDAEDTAVAVAALAAGGQRLIIDLEALDFIDCHAVGALLGVRATARQAGGDVLLAAPHGPVLRLLTLLGVPGVYASVAAAADSAGRRDAGRCGQHRAIRESGAVRCRVLDDGVAGWRPGVACRKQVLVGAVTVRARGLRG
jgi:anti-anti-sigma factor